MYIEIDPQNFRSLGLFDVATAAAHLVASAAGAELDDGAIDTEVDDDDPDVRAARVATDLLDILLDLHGGTGGALADALSQFLTMTTEAMRQSGANPRPQRTGPAGTPTGTG